MALADALLTQALRRLDELTPATPTRWTRAEVLVFLNDALHELNLIAAAFQSTASLNVTGAANVYATPAGTIAPLAVSAGGKYLQPRTIADLDDEVDWELPSAVRLHVADWAPLGLTKILIHPRPLSAQSLDVERLVEHTAVTDAAVALPVAAEYEGCLENYIVGRALFKEGGGEFTQGTALYNDYLRTVQELSGRTLVTNRPTLDIARSATSQTTLRERAQRPAAQS